MYATPLASLRAGALFNAFSYPTKISPEAIALFLATHTRPHSTVLDVFGGSGTLGLAAHLCARPSPALLKMAAARRLRCAWGPRTAIVSELSTVGAFVARVMNDPPDPARFRAAATRFLDRCEQRLGGLYRARSPNGRQGMLRHAIWSDVLVCPRCRRQGSFWDGAVRTGRTTRIAPRWTCPKCHTASPPEACGRVTERVRDRLTRRMHMRKRRVLVRMYGSDASGRWQRAPTRADVRVFAQARRRSLPAGTPVVPVVWADLHRAGYHFGIDHVHHFYSDRNLTVLASMWKMVADEPPEVHDALRLLLLSYNAAHATLMTRVVVKDGQRDFALTGAQSGVLYISHLPVEKNLIAGARRKLATLASAFAAVHASGSKVRVLNASSTHLDLADASVDYVFTDPPFGDYIPYAELNQINEAWLGAPTDRREEAVISPGQGKRLDTYGGLMRRVFAEIARVLRPNGLATVVFHNAHATVWAALEEAYRQAGLVVLESGVLDKTQGSFKQVSGDTCVRGDPLLLLRHDARPSRSTPCDARAFVRREARTGLSQERLYSLYLGRCLRQGAPVAVDAREFYALVDELA